MDPTPRRYRSVFVSDIHPLEHFDGCLEILEWAKLRSWSMIERARRIDGALEGTPSLA